TSLVYYRTATSLDTFMVNYYNFRMRPGSPNNFAPAGFTNGGADRIFIKKFQIVLANSDSSIQINYGPFSGSVNSFPPVLAWSLFEANSAIGLVNETGSQATSVLYGPRGASTRWDAKNPNCRSCNKDFKQSGQWAIKFKRWHNIVRALAVDFPPRNYEICLGTSVTPKGQFMNVDSTVQTFKVRFQIRNVVTGIAVYSRVVSLINVLPGGKIDTVFEPYATNPNILSQLGTFNACAVATPYDTSDRFIGDQWPFDDTVCTTIFGVRRTTQPFRDASDNYSRTTAADIPDQTLWISIGATVVDGEDATWDPPPPRDLNGAGFGPDNFHSPVIRLDRTDVNGNGYSGSGVGDTLLSFPINLQGYSNCGLTFDYMRAGQNAYPWLWDQDVMLGPEWTILNVLGNVVRRGDSLAVEFKKPTEPGCNPSSGGWTEITAIDGGQDFEFKQFFIKLESLKTNYFTADFRFRLRLKAKYDGNALNPPPSDDDDPWFIDNPTVIVPRKPEIEVMWVRVVNPYTKIPASQAVTLPIYVKVKNMSSDVAIAFPLKVQILDNSTGNTLYWHTVTVNSLRGGSDSVIQMPNWNAQDATNGAGNLFIANAFIDEAGYDSYSLDDGTYTKFYLNVEQGQNARQEFAYDDGGLTPAPGVGNGIPNVVLISGAGVGFNGYNGSFATKFKLAQKDTLYGVDVYFANANQAPDAIRLSVLNGDPSSCTPGDTVTQQKVQATFQDVRRGGYFNQFWPYYFPKPIVLAGGADAGATRGNYWVSVSQLGLENMDNGGDLSRGGGWIKVWDPNYQTPQIPPIYSSPYGTQYSNNGNNGDISCVWALEVTAGSGAWARWTPSAGWWPTQGYAGNPVAVATNVNAAYYIWGGSYTPMIRPMVSQSIMLPIDLVYLHGQKEDDGTSLLTWATSSEQDNAGFFIERKNNAIADDMFSRIGFVAAKQKNSTEETGYAYADRNVTPGTYTYQLIQMDVNGVEHRSNSVELTIDAPKDFSLSQNYPNPFTPVNGSTDMSYTVPTEGQVSLVIYNQLGNVVRTLVDGNVDAGVHPARWDGKDDGGNEVVSGTYICRLSSGEHTATVKMTVSK
ncbi:MAG TPA: FlgD immunoglobulin-like domain containing protein, partial [Candidatus Kapabacteria bacterium]|nr:FlgD immunoglobulin-like domain containing protein [Candidatus Kapabacteria bacterium]